MKKMKVVVRIRPFQPNQQICIKALSDHELEVQHKGKLYKYSFNRVLTSSQLEVFEHTAMPIIRDVLEGYSATIFAYGATGSGKTYTMLGSLSQPGLISKTLVELFSSIHQNTSKKYLIKASFLEIYNEEIKDLLGDNSGLELREDAHKGMIVLGLSEVMLSSPEAVEKVIREGSQRRITEFTKANASSSRSHAVLVLCVESQETPNEITFGKICLVDLAGSERASQTSNKGLRFTEGTNINKSLLHLGNCIEALATGKAHIPYRNSKLTRLLRDSLNGTCTTVMIACISPISYEDSINTLKYASKASRIKLDIKKIVINRSKYTEKLSKIQESISKKGEDEIEGELSRHFTQEIELKKEIHQLQYAIDQYSFELFSKQSNTSDLLAVEIESIQEIISHNELRLRSLYFRLSDLESKRQNFQTEWKKKLPSSALPLMELKLRSHILNIQNLEHERSEAVIKQKDLLISMLTDQLNKRDKLIHETTKFMHKSNLQPPCAIADSVKDLRSIRQLTQRVRSLPRLASPQSKIPRPRLVERCGSPNLRIRRKF